MNGEFQDTRWDAYEALDGASFRDVTTSPQPWSIVKFWFRDLATELDLANRDGTTPPLTLDHLWVSPRGLHLLDFAIQRATREGVDTPASSAKAFLTRTAEHAMGATGADGRWTVTQAIPIEARRLIEQLAFEMTSTLTEVRTAAVRLAARPDCVTRRMRAGTLLWTTTLLITGVIMPVSRARWNPGINQDALVLRAAIQEMRLLDRRQMPRTTQRVRERAALDVFVAAEYGRLRSSMPGTLAAIDSAPSLKNVAQAALERHPSVSPFQAARAEEILKPYLEVERARNAGADSRSAAVYYATRVMLIIVGFGLISATALRGGIFLYAMGMSVVSLDGTPVGRLHAFLRATIAWSSLIVLTSFCACAFGMTVWPPMWSAWTPAQQWVAIACGLVMTAGAAWAVYNPERGVQDLIAGTTIVVR
jgi:hypothetical protein